jgi:hypothetical protein
MQQRENIPKTGLKSKLPLLIRVRMDTFPPVATFDNARVREYP